MEHSPNAHPQPSSGLPVGLAQHSHPQPSSGARCLIFGRTLRLLSQIIDKGIEFFSQNTNLLPPKPKSSFRHLKQDIQEFHRKYVLVPADKATNNVIVVRRLHYGNTFKQKLGGIKTYKLQNSADEKSVVVDHCCHTATKFAVTIKEDQGRLKTSLLLLVLAVRIYTLVHQLCE